MKTAWFSILVVSALALGSILRGSGTWTHFRTACTKRFGAREGAGPAPV